MKAKHVGPSFALLLTFAAMLAAPAAGQCILANPSFELGGSGTVFGGWNQFGTVGVATETVHGGQAARVTGPDSGDWGVSGYWQRLDSAPGEQWEVTGHARHPASAPLTGECFAVVNVEWRNAAGDLIDYQSITVASPSTATDTYVDFAFTSSPAPPGTVAVHLLLGVLQSPTDPAPSVYYDQITCFSTGPPTIDDLQWNDFPGGRTIIFGGRAWRVKGPGYFGPGPNVFSDAEDYVWLDGQDQLHLTLQNPGGTWISTEVTLEESLGYGDYILTTVGRLDLLDPEAVLGIFLWEYGPCWDDAYTWWNAFNEFDIEYSRWGDPTAGIGQFVAQPYHYPGNISRFDATCAEGEVTSLAFRWLPGRVECRAWRGGPGDESVGNMIHAWNYDGPHIPRPEQPRLHLNLWKRGDAPDTNQEVVFRAFTFVPEGTVAVADGRLPGAPAGRLLPAAPNPFNPQTTIRFELRRGGIAELAVYDLSGQRVRTLASGHHTAGEHRATWNGRNDRGHALASGVYLVRLRGADYVEMQPVALIK